MYLGNIIYMLMKNRTSNKPVVEGWLLKCLGKFLSTHTQNIVQTSLKMLIKSGRTSGVGPPIQQVFEEVD